jgi:hypothetical protein
VLNFWLEIGYGVVGKGMLSWHGAALRAVTMKKTLTVIGTNRGSDNGMSKNSVDPLVG